MKNSFSAIIVMTFIAITQSACTYSQNSTSSAVDTSVLVSAAPANAELFFIEPANGAIVSSPVTVKFGLNNMTVAPAGDNTEHSGHHHILIDLNELPDMTLPLPANDNVVHFGAAQTETELELEPGQHTLQLLLGNYLHIPHNPPVISETITITVQ